MIGTEAQARAWFREVLGVDQIAMSRLESLSRLLAAESERQNLVSKASLADIWVRHFVDSAQLLTVPRGTSPNGCWLDLGTGGGFPGLVISICRPDLHVHLVDSRRLRTDWLNAAVAQLELVNAIVVKSRVETLELPPVQTISARAFAPLEELVAISARFSTPHTLWLLPKGARAAQELSTLSNRWDHMFHVEQSITEPGAGIVIGRLLGPR